MLWDVRHKDEALSISDTIIEGPTAIAHTSLSRKKVLKASPSNSGIFKASDALLADTGRDSKLSTPPSKIP
jgi:hypothetical protein